MRRLNKVTLSLAMIGLVATADVAVAAQAEGTITFGTIQDVSVRQDKAVNFGDDMVLAKDKKCIIGFEGKYAASTKAPEIDTGKKTRSGDCPETDFDAANAIGGQFTIEGAASQTVKVTVTGATENNLLFEPTGNILAGAVGKTASADLTGITAVALTDGGQKQIELSTDTDNFGVGTNKGYATIFVGGKLTATDTLPANETLKVNYTVSVTY